MEIVDENTANFILLLLLVFVWLVLLGVPPPIDKINTTTRPTLLLNPILSNGQLDKLADKLGLSQQPKKLITVSRSDIILIINIYFGFYFLFYVVVLGCWNYTGIVLAARARGGVGGLWGWGWGQGIVDVVLEVLPEDVEMYCVVQLEAA